MLSPFPKTDPLTVDPLSGMYDIASSFLTPAALLSGVFSCRYVLKILPKSAY